MSDTTDWSSQVLSRIDKQCNYGDYSIKVLEGPQSIPIVGRRKQYPNGHYSRNRTQYGCMSEFVGLPPCLALGFYLCEVSKPQDSDFTTQRIYLCTCCTELCGICGEEQIVVCEANTINVMTVNGHPMALRQGSLTMVKTVVEKGSFGFEIRDLGDRIKKDIERMCRSDVDGSYLVRYKREPEIDGKCMLYRMHTYYYVYCIITTFVFVLYRKWRCNRSW